MNTLNCNLACFIAWLSLTAPLLAQDTVARAPEQSNWMTVVVAIVLVMCVAVASLIKSKRDFHD